jgi:transcriptional regulator with XRE-family HTH domain
MQEQELSKLELANRAGLSVSFVSDITTGKANPSLKVMASLAKALQVPLPLLLLEPSGDIWSLVRCGRFSLSGVSQQEKAKD